MVTKVFLTAAVACGLVVAPALAAVFPEVEPNDTKAAANPVVGIVAGDMITGTSTGSSTITPGVGSADYFLLTTGGLPPGIYKHRLVLTTGGTAGHTGTIRGLTQTAGVPNAGTDASAQSSSSATIPPRFNQWYGFGAMEQIYYRVTGTTSTTAPYNATMETTAVTPVDLGSFNVGGPSGNLRIETIGQTTVDTDLWVYDGSFNAIPTYGNDDESIAGGGTGTTLQSLLNNRTYTAGQTYYLALTNFNLANNQGSPPDDDFRTGTVLDFPNAVLNSSTSTTATDLDFLVTDSTGPHSFSALRGGPYDIYWAKFTVIPEPATMGLLALGGLALLRRRR